MKNLFIRVLLVLLGAFFMVALTSTLLFWWVSHEIEPHKRDFGNLSRHVATQLIEKYEHGNIGKFKHRLRHRFKGRFWILDQEGNPKTNSHPTQDILSQIVRYPMIIYPYQNTAGRDFIFAHEIQGNQENYRVIMTSRFPLFPPRNRFIYIWLPVLTVILGLISSSAMLGYWILRPVRIIRNTTGELSGDNLDARVPESVTCRKDAFGELGREFNRMSERVKRTVSSQNGLLRDVSHELRSPLARIQVAASLAARKSGEQTELTRIHDEVERLNNLIEDLLSLTRLKNRTEIDRENINIRSLLSDLLSDANYEFQQSDRQGQLSDGPDVWTQGNRELLYSLFENVIRNGMRYTPKGETLQVHCRAKAGTIKITVMDSGPGVDPASLDQIFEPFFRADPARDTSTGHHGIGLTLAKTIAELHGGSISARNLDTQGFEVSVEIPCLADDVLPSNAGFNPS